MENPVSGDADAIVRFVESLTPWRCQVTGVGDDVIISLEHEFSPGLDVAFDSQRFTARQAVERHILANPETVHLQWLPEGADPELYLELIAMGKVLADTQGVYGWVLDLLALHGVIRHQDHAWLESRQRGYVAIFSPSE